jgi:hypothetical protein
VDSEAGVMDGCSLLYAHELVHTVMVLWIPSTLPLAGIKPRVDVSTMVKIDEWSNVPC